LTSNPNGIKLNILKGRWNESIGGWVGDEGEEDGIATR